MFSMPGHNICCTKHVWAFTCIFKTAKGARQAFARGLRGEEKGSEPPGAWKCPYLNILNLEPMQYKRQKRKMAIYENQKQTARKTWPVGQADAPTLRKPAETEKFWNAALCSDCRKAWLVAGENPHLTVSFDDWLGCWVSHSPALKKDLIFLPQW